MKKGLLEEIAKHVFDLVPFALGLINIVELFLRRYASPCAP